MAEYAFFSSAPGTFSTWWAIKQTLINKNMEIVTTIFSDHIALKIEVKYSHGEITFTPEKSTDFY